MRLLTRHPIFTMLLVFGLLSSPATYRGGSAAAHPHMFLQVWHDAASGSFSHHPAEDSHSHHHHMVHASPLPTELSDSDRPTASAFVVSDLGFTVLASPQLVLYRSPEQTQVRRDMANDIQSGLEIPPETPPPRF